MAATAGAEVRSCLETIGLIPLVITALIVHYAQLAEQSLDPVMAQRTGSVLKVSKDGRSVTFDPPTAALYRRSAVVLSRYQLGCPFLRTHHIARPYHWSVTVNNSDPNHNRSGRLFGAIGIATRWDTDAQPLLSRADAFCYTLHLMDGSIAHDQRRSAFAGSPVLPGDTVHVIITPTAKQDEASGSATVRFARTRPPIAASDPVAAASDDFGVAFVLPREVDPSQLYVYLCLADTGDAWTCDFNPPPLHHSTTPPVTVI